MSRVEDLADQILSGAYSTCSLPEGAYALLIAALGRLRPLTCVVSDDVRLKTLKRHLDFFAPELSVHTLPAWDCLPYDRMSPRTDLMAQRMHTLCQKHRPVTLTTAHSSLQRFPHVAHEEGEMRLEKGKDLSMDSLRQWCVRHAYRESGTVREAGEYAVRGGLIDIFPAGHTYPVRMDFFGDTLDSAHTFDPFTQRRLDEVTHVTLVPASELCLTQDTQSLFQTRYRSLFGTRSEKDSLYESLSCGQTYPGMEHWLPLFCQGMTSVFDHETFFVLDSHVESLVEARTALISESYEERVSAQKVTEDPYRPLPPQDLYLSLNEWKEKLSQRAAITLTPYTTPSSLVSGFLPLPLETPTHLLDTTHKKHLFFGSTPGRIHLLKEYVKEHTPYELEEVKTWPQVGSTPAVALGDLDESFETPEALFHAEGHFIKSPAPKRRTKQHFMPDLASLRVGDLVVHVEHGIGQYDGLDTLTIAGTSHESLRLLYREGDKLYVPVENMDLVSSFSGQAPLDRLGGRGWNERTLRAKKRVRDIAQQLLSVAAERALQKAPALHMPQDAYQTFCESFGFVETEDQQHTIDDVLADMASERPMDRLVCGDVGFGKTEVALRAALCAAMCGYQVAMIAPTTLLAEQHVKTFQKRFEDFPLKVGSLSRFVPSKRARALRQDLAEGRLDIVIGTHALLNKSTTFARLGLMVVDEEQHFGVSQKERLKDIQKTVHCLTLTATPIPRTLQMALVGVRDLSVIASPPVDRLAVRTFVLPFDSVTVKEALLREWRRGGQSFYVSPRISELPRLLRRVQEMMPGLRVAVAHGGLTTTELDDIMGRFVGREIDVLIATHIIESGLDIPNANTLIVHHAHRFGLSQLYQLRGRVGRSRVRGYCYLTVPSARTLRDKAGQRLKMMQTLDGLGAGFQLASFDLDVRGAGYLLGEKQSGHMMEVGAELYQTLLHEAIVSLQEGTAATEEPPWSPVLSLGMDVLIPPWYVPDLGVRLSLYKEISGLEEEDKVHLKSAELVDRFGGPLPEAVSNLIQVVHLKIACKRAWISKVDVGAKGTVVSFRNNHVPHPEALIAWGMHHSGVVKFRPDHKLVITPTWTTPQEVLEGLVALVESMPHLEGEGM